MAFKQVNTLLTKLKAPLLLLWGDKDPWIVPSRVSECQAEQQGTCFI